MPNIDNDNIIAALYLYKKRIAILKKETARTVGRAESKEITQLEGELQLSLITNEINDIVNCLNVLNHLLESD